MLRKIFIQNYAIIDHLELNLQEGLNIITGETGAGKSILLGALGLIMGKRADTKVLYDQERKCIVEADIDIAEYKLRDYFEKSGLDYFDDLNIRREIAPGGKSRAFVNDTPVTLDQLQELTEKLIAIHQQFDMLDIQRAAFQMEILDALSCNGMLLQSYKSQYKHVQQLRKSLEELIQKQKNSQNEADFLSFQLDELNKLKLQAGEMEEIEQTLSILNAAEDIKRITSHVAITLEESESSVNGNIRNLIHQLETLSHLDAGFENMKQRLSSCYEELADIAKEASQIAEDTEFEPAQIERLNDRLNQIFRLLKKHNLKSGEELIDFHNELQAKFQSLGNTEVEIEDKQKELNQAEEVLSALAENLHQNRIKAIPGFEENINSSVKQLGMEHAQIQVRVEKTPTLGVDGCDEVQFLFASNKGSKFQLLKDIASGGEISRLTLCIKAFVAGAMTLPTLIFDEIDTGVSGEIARKMGSLLAQLSEKHQVIAISHSPQIAAKASNQFFVFKKITGDRTITAIRKLEPEERRYEIAKMLSGDPPTESALANAAELLQK